MPQKLGVAPSPKQNNLVLAPMSTAAPTTPPPSAEDDIIISKPCVHETGLEALPFASAEPEVIVPKSHPSYSSAVQAPAKRVTTPELDYSGSTASESDESEDNLGHSPTISKSKPVNPNIVSQCSELGLFCQLTGMVNIASFEACVSCHSELVDGLTGLIYR